MEKKTRRALTGLVLVVTALSPVTLLASPASAFPKGDPVYNFKYKVVATTFIKRSNMTMTAPPGVFEGGIDLSTGQLNGSINIPDTKFTQTEAGIGLVTVTAAVEPLKPVTGHVNLGNFHVTSTSVFNIHIKSMYPATPKVPLPLPLPKVNLVGDGCITRHPVTVTISGTASLGSPSTLKGKFLIPLLQNCEAMTSVLNQQIPGPGNTFSATATPM